MTIEAGNKQRPAGGNMPNTPDSDKPNVITVVLIVPTETRRVLLVAIRSRRLLLVGVLASAVAASLVVAAASLVTQQNIRHTSKKSICTQGCHQGG